MLHILLDAALASAEATFEIYENADNVLCRLPGVQPRRTLSIPAGACGKYARPRSPVGLTDLGLVDGAPACQKSCVSRLGADPTTGCTSFTYYHAGHPTRAKQCFGDNTGRWTPFYSRLDSIRSQNVTQAA